MTRARASAKRIQVLGINLDQIIIGKVDHYYKREE